MSLIIQHITFVGYATQIQRHEEVAPSSRILLVEDSSFPVPVAAKDLPILAGAVAQRCTHLLTGDKKDFGCLFGQTVHGVKIVSPSLLAEEMAQAGLIQRRTLAASS